MSWGAGGRFSVGEQEDVEVSGEQEEGFNVGEQEDVEVWGAHDQQEDTTNRRAPIARFSC